MAAAGGEFVEGWLVAQVLGEGAYGEVRLLVHARSGARVALKAVGRSGGEGGGGGGAGGGGGSREAALHRALRHPHVLRCLGERAHRDHHYLFLEWAAGGELFERIAPDAGMPPAQARRYWRQAAAGLRYLHARGVAHRDIKPENLLLDHHDNVKISDFGMATLYRHGARERLLSRVCGTLPYAAPEVHDAARRPYRAPPADVWAAGVVLLAMLAGELPWERAVPADPRYAAWARWAGAGAGQGEGQPPPPGGVWARVPPPALRWLRRALQPDARRRAPLADLLLDRWMADTPLQTMGSRGCLSQPAGGAGSDECDGAGGGGGGGASVHALSAADMDALLSCSQPASADDLLLCSQRGPLPASPATAPGTGIAHTEAASADAFGVSAARRMARVCVAGDEAAAWRALLAALPRAAAAPRRLDARTLAVECGAGLRMRAWIAHTTGDTTEVQFRRWRGCGMAFQRRFLELRAALAEHAAVTPPPAPLAAPAVSTHEPMDE
ncbi:hypothetical protein O0L34_g1982 [Tuta absoluta]|nr:hypothetical protein O0L34_g1982 [Tuta absoluta]